MVFPWNRGNARFTGVWTLRFASTRKRCRHMKAKPAAVACLFLWRQSQGPRWIAFLRLPLRAFVFLVSGNVRGHRERGGIRDLLLQNDAVVLSLNTQLIEFVTTSLGIYRRQTPLAWPMLDFWQSGQAVRSQGGTHEQHFLHHRRRRGRACARGLFWTPVTLKRNNRESAIMLARQAARSRPHVRDDARRRRARSDAPDLEGAARDEGLDQPDR
jgi:hypothetical protein